jgi:hypothetical protein
MGGFFGGGGSVDLASPPAIGSTTPNTGAFTTLSANNGTLTSSSPAFTLAQTWNSAGVVFTALRANVTDTASASGSLLMDLQVGGSSRFSFSKSGTFTASAWMLATSEIYAGGSLGSSQFYAGSSGINLGSATFVAWTSGNSLGTKDTYLYRDAANILAQRNSTNAQTFRLYRTFTDASNYERLGFLTTNTTRYTITSENAGTGSARSLEVSFYTAASDPTSTDITSGCFGVWKNSGTGTIKLWANDGGTMKSVALA